MNTATNHWKLGLFVLLGAAGIVGSLFWLGASRLNRPSFPAVTYFDESVQGLDKGSPVKFRGVTLGSVSDITVAPDHRLVQVTADIYVDAITRLGFRDAAPVPSQGDPFVPEDMRVQLVSAGITGVRFLQTDFLDPERFPLPQLPFTPPWNYIPSAPSTLKSVEVRVMEVLDRLPGLSDRADGMMVEAENSLASVRRLADALEQDNEPFRKLLSRLESAAEAVEVATREAKLGPTAKSVRDSADSLGQAGDAVTAARDELLASLIAFRQALDSIRSLSDALDRDPSSLLLGPRVDGAGPPRP